MQMAIWNIIECIYLSDESFVMALRVIWGLVLYLEINITSMQTRYVVEVEFTLKEQLHKWHKSSIWWWLQWWWWRLNFSPIFFPLYNLQTWIICARLTSASYNAIFLLQSGGKIDCLNFFGEFVSNKSPLNLFPCNSLTGILLIITLDWLLCSMILFGPCWKQI